MLLSAVVGICLACSSLASAGPPSYLLLRTAPGQPHGHRAHPSGVGHEVRAQGYAYGWFGVKPRQHAERQFGYYRTYTQWSGW